MQNGKYLVWSNKRNQILFSYLNILYKELFVLLSVNSQVCRRNLGMDIIWSRLLQAQEIKNQWNCDKKKRERKIYWILIISWRRTEKWILSIVYWWHFSMSPQWYSIWIIFPCQWAFTSDKMIKHKLTSSLGLVIFKRENLSCLY